MRKWSVRIVLLDKDEKEHPATCFTKVVFNLHPSFENPVQSKLPPRRKDAASRLLSTLQPSPSPPSSARTRDGVSSRCRSSSTTPTRVARSPFPTT